MLYSLPRLGSLTFDLNASAFRKTALGLTAATLMAFGTSAHAQQISRATQELTQRVMNDPSITLSTDCNKYLPGEIGADALCEVRKGRILDAQGRALDQDNAKLEDQRKCIDFLKAGIANNQIVKSEMLKIAGGKVTGENVCAVAKNFGLGRRASISSNPKLELSQR
jgi:hypothetical protein